MNQIINASRHDAYAQGYDHQVQAYDCHVADTIFGLCYEFLQPGQNLLDAGIGTGLSAQLFAKAGLVIHGFDFSPAMLEICRSKELAVELIQHDIQLVPWPYSSSKFDHLLCCGVLHFIPDLESIFGEAERLVRKGGVFAFSSRSMSPSKTRHPKYARQIVDGFEIFSHSPDYLESLLKTHTFLQLKTQKIFVGNDHFLLWILQKL